MRGAINKVLVAKQFLNDILFPKIFIKIMLPSQSVAKFLCEEMVGFDFCFFLVL